MNTNRLFAKAVYAVFAVAMGLGTAELVAANMEHAGRAMRATAAAQQPAQVAQVSSDIVKLERIEVTGSRAHLKARAAHHAS